MLIKNIFIVAAPCIAIMGCATTGQYQTKLATYVGQPKEVLMTKWGKPTGQYTDENGDEVVAYISSRAVIVPSTSTLSGSPSIGDNGVNFGQVSTSNGSPTGSIHLSCMTKFTIRNGVVNSSTFKGNDCKTRNW